MHRSTTAWTLLAFPLPHTHNVMMWFWTHWCRSALLPTLPRVAPKVECRQNFIFSVDVRSPAASRLAHVRYRSTRRSLLHVAASLFHKNYPIPFPAAMHHAKHGNNSGQLAFLTFRNFSSLKIPCSFLILPSGFLIKSGLPFEILLRVWAMVPIGWCLRRSAPARKFFYFLFFPGTVN